uniref:Uncharacterized protein n=4 Tax=Aegilops tauschii subsp. strangulata TaxID=200361 RepID=A0A453CQL8_AEGTS
RDEFLPRGLRQWRRGRLRGRDPRRGLRQGRGLRRGLRQGQGRRQALMHGAVFLRQAASRAAPPLLPPGPRLPRRLQRADPRDGGAVRLEHMRWLVRRGRWYDALFYLNIFLPPLKSERRSLRARIFHNFLLMHGRFADVVAGNKDPYLDKQYANGRSNSTDAERRFRSMNYSILAPDAGQLRAAIDWDRVRSHAEFVVRKMALATPELRRPMVLPSRCMMPHDVLPIGTGLFRKRRVKKQGPQPPKREATALKQYYY